MNRSKLFSAIWTCGCLWLLACAPARTVPSVSAHPVDLQNPESLDLQQLQTLAGCWQNQAGDSIELWLPPESNLMLGLSQSVRKGRVVFYERLMIRRNQQGILEYVAAPKGQEAVVFTLSRFQAGELSFTNPSHDFPTAIHYRIPARQQLRAAISGQQNGENVRIAFNKQRADCSAMLGYNKFSP